MPSFFCRLPLPPPAPTLVTGAILPHAPPPPARAGQLTEKHLSKLNKYFGDIKQVEDKNRKRARMSKDQKKGKRTAAQMLVGRRLSLAQGGTPALGGPARSLITRLHTLSCARDASPHAACNAHAGGSRALPCSRGHPCAWRSRTGLVAACGVPPPNAAHGSGGFPFS